VKLTRPESPQSGENSSNRKFTQTISILKIQTIPKDTGSR